MKLDSKKTASNLGAVFFVNKYSARLLHGVFFSGMLLILISQSASLLLLLGKARLIEKKNPAA
ncbi:hypothetical protein [Brevibacillus parabrevis]|jgi:hypothetical protein|uniref:hypothetical protein n=1 Tax=Brevibacillus parabrevis TaxID=54914 RepID=UPI000ECD2C78|nr:hypothetical protein [Brevibacillus sp.]